MEQAIEFSINHWPLVGSFVVLLALALHMEFNKGGAALSVHEVTIKINNEDARVIDIREAKEFKDGHIVDAINVPLVKLDSEIKNLNKYKEKPLIVVCQMGQQSGQAVLKLQAAGFEKVFKLSGGMSGWRTEKLPVIKS